MMTYYKNILGTALVVFVTLLPVVVSASTIQFQDSTVSIKPGETFAVHITLVPDAPAQYTARFILQFPPALIEVSSFSFDPAWIPLPQKGYDLIDNTGGQLIKTAGFPGGFTGSTLFGTITFKAKATGEGLLTVGPNSFLLNNKNKNTLISRPQIALRVGTAKGTLTPPESLPIGQPSLFDIEVNVGSSQAGVNWIPWVVGLMFCLFVVYIIWIHRGNRRRE